MTAIIKQIGTIILDSELYINEFNTPNSMLGEAFMSVDGSHISFSAEIKTPYRTAESRGDSGWLSESQVTALKALWVSGTTFLITYDDDSTEEVRMAHEKDIDFNEISLGTCIYTCFIPMAKV